MAIGVLGVLFVARGFLFSIEAPEWTIWINPLGWMNETKLKRCAEGKRGRRLLEACQPFQREPEITQRPGHVDVIGAERALAEHEVPILTGPRTGEGVSILSRVSPATVPPGRRLSAMVHDAARRRVMMFGGDHALRAVLDDTWTWDGQTWSDITSSGAPTVYGHRMAYDEARRVIVVFGGLDARGLASDETWEFDGTDWQRRHPLHEPSPRAGHEMVYDRAREVTLLFGGFGPDGVPKGDTWLWDGNAWTLSNARGPSRRRIPTATAGRKDPL